MKIDGWTVEKALQVGLTMEQGAMKLYTDAQKMVKNPGSKQLLKELAGDETKHAEYFEKALKDPKKVMDSSKASDLTRVVQDLGVSDPLIGEPLSKYATYQDILIFAAKSEKTANEFYMALAKQYKGHPLAKMWEEFAKMEAGHKLKLEKEYDEVVLADN
jgi:rubrerythrin